ncbi:1-phosphofructokinase family hexose kinase [Fodinibius sediminis]|uniref:1-phosphofructokinase/tagatose 6-phosphate kinase n=1 Tax=Fodinibius sediminis TaxID=1214077 RepID=A0A521C005_9BACT|nr:PfkB family carbohydrate kinase [Fodinibius sediminis]SMO52743.1 1-phosphofructokinase/tagatose 6-phosphate kinase [Fodinibius sediminis]
MILTVCANPSVDSFWAIDQIQRGTTNRSAAESFYPGGKGIHTAFALRELGQQVMVLGVWGGQTGQWLKEQCLERDIEPVGPHVEAWTRICITNQSATEWNETEILGGGPSIAAHQVRKFKTTYQQCLADENIKAVTIGGSAARGFGDKLYAEMIELAQEAGRPVFLDASGLLLKNALAAQPYAIHINRDEGKQLCGKEDPAAIARWLSAHCTLAAVTNGADGLYLLHDGQLWHSSHYLAPSEIHSTIGSGDCLLAGLCLATFNYDFPEQWAKFATACGSANCISPQLGMLAAADVHKIFEHVTVTSVSPPES